MTEQLLDKVYEFVEHYIEEFGVSPTLREIADGCHISMGSVLDTLSVLEARGDIERVEGVHRPIRIVLHG